MALTPTFINTWRKKRGISARVLGLALGYRGREYIKKIEGGYCPITQPFERRFLAFKNQTQNPRVSHAGDTEFLSAASAGEDIGAPAPM